MKKGFLSFLFAIAAILLIVCPSGTILAEADTTTISYNVTYRQSDARSMLTMINEFRTGSEAWYWNSDNTTKTTCTDLSALTYDYTLEKIAMQRAAEIAIYYSHTRPSGNDCWSAYSEVSGAYTYTGENIAAGYGSASAAFTGWQETNEAYSGQGHRRNMLSSNFNAVGIACVYYNGYYYWVQEFGYTSSINTSATSANDNTTTVSASIASSYIDDVSLTADPTTYSLEVGGATASVPTVRASVYLTSASAYWPSGSIDSTTVSPTWSVNDSTLLSISDGTLTALAPGTATLTASALGTSASVATVTITAPVSSCTISLDTSDYTYDGTEKKPVVTVAYGSTVLTEGTGYTLSYSNNVNAGTATVTITGMGYYTGSVDKTFTISPKDLEESMVELDTANSYTYDGTAKEASVTVTDGAVLANGTDYSLSYSDNINAGTATVTITGIGNYTGSVAKSFTIDPANISDSTVTVASGEYVYNGTAQEPLVTVTKDSVLLTEGTDYTDISYSNNVNAGTATVTVTGKGNYTGTATGEFTIEQKTLTAAISGTTTKTYDGTTSASDDLSLTLADIVGEDDVSAAAESYVYNSANVAESTTITASGITLSGRDAGNYQLSSTTATITAAIAKADYSAAEYVQKVASGQAVSDASVDLSADIMTGGVCGTPSLSGNNAELIDSSSLSVSGNTVSFATTSQEDQTTAMITVPVTGCDNYNDYEIPITVTAVDIKLSVDGTITGYTGIAIADKVITLTIGNENIRFTDSLTGSWITNLPAGLSQSMKRVDDTTVAITVSGTVSEVSSSILELTIPAGNLADIGGSVNVCGGSLEIEKATYELSLTENAAELAELTYGYVSGSSVTYTFKNTGNQNVTNISAETTAGFTASLSGAEAATDESITVTVTSDTGLSAGVTTGDLILTWTNAEEAWSCSLSQTVNKAENVLEITGDLAKAYDGTAASVTVSAAYGAENAVITWADAEGAALDAAPTDAGNYIVTVSIAESDNYEAAVVTADYQITLATPVVSLEDKSVTYTGEAVSIEEAAVTLVNDETYEGDIVYTYYSDAECTEKLDQDTLPAEAGTYYVTAAIDAFGNYTGAVSEAATLTIASAAQSIAYETMEVTKTEGDDAFTNALTVTTVYGTITYTSSDTSVAAVDENGLVTIVGSGTAIITAVVSDSKSYTAAAASYTLTVNAAPEEETETESETETVTEAETESGTEATTEAKAETETESEAESESETEAATEAQTESKTEAATEAQTESETKAQTESETETETETETEASVQTGDDSNLFFWSIIMLLGALGFIMALTYSRTR
ncbi:MAG: CAP domain-containing protein, partial [Lachnospiraceae bacterium]|nr:CAP domain-containing protein [Lachnospiraceae bacterium]